MANKRFSLFNLGTRRNKRSTDKKIVHSQNDAGCFHQPNLLLCATSDAWSEVVGFFSSIRQWVVSFSIFSMEAAENSEMEKWTDRWVQERFQFPVADCSYCYIPPFALSNK